MKKVLLVDDSETIRNEVRAILAENPNIEILEAENGLFGLERLKENEDLALMIVDVNMPEMDGITMVRKIHDKGTYGHIPIVMLTTETSKELKAVAKEHGVRAWILKPCDEAKIKIVVDKLLS